MAMPRYQLIYKEKSTHGPVLRQICDGEKRLDVLERTTLERLNLRARDISIYRHSLLIDNKPYDILNVLAVH